MNKPELAAAIAEAHNLSKTQALDILNTTLGAIVAAVADGEKVAIDKFGVFEQVHKPARTARNPQTGDPIEVAAKDVPVFKPAGAFKTAVNGRGSPPTPDHAPGRAATPGRPPNPTEKGAEL